MLPSRTLMAGLVLLTSATAMVLNRHQSLPVGASAEMVVASTPEVHSSQEPSTSGFLGVVIADGAVELATLMAGRVESVRVQVGERVRQGEVMAALDTKATQQELALAEVELLSARAEQQVATLLLQEDSERLQRVDTPMLVERGAISQDELSKARYARNTAAARLEVVRLRVLEREARVTHLRSRMAESVIRAPFDGVVASLFAHPGALSREGQPLLRLLRLDKPRIRFAIPAPDLERVFPGREILVTVPDRLGVFAGRVAQVAPEVDVASHMVFALAELQMEPEAPPLPSGTAVRVGLMTEEARAARVAGRNSP